MTKSENTVELIKNYVKEMKEVFAKQTLIKNPKRQSIRNAKWRAPPVGEEEEKAGYRGIIRTHEGEWIGGYIANLGCCNVYQSELWAILHDLRTV
ncbi:hypothetical protein AHAS_Ahas06G0007000 [Arachis hypogaea]